MEAIAIQQSIIFQRLTDNRDMGDITRIAIIDHETHELWVEDIENEELDNLYDGEIQEFIDANYSGFIDWDFIIGAEYVPSDHASTNKIIFEKNSKK